MNFKLKHPSNGNFRNRITASILVILFIPGLGIACSSLKNSSDTIPRGCKICATPEPGTYIDRKALLIVKNANKLSKNPTKTLKVTSTLTKLIEPVVKEVRDTTIFQDSLYVPIRYYYPKQALHHSPAPMIFFIHGGAFMYGDLDVYDMLMKKLARETGCIIVSVEYRLAPENPFPAGLNDCYAAFQWVAEHAAEFGGNPKNISIMGDSAGGNLAAGTVLMSREHKGPRAARQILIYPSTSFLDTIYPSREYFSGRHGEAYLLSEELMLEVKESYLRPGEDVTNPYISPICAELSSELPPALIITSQCDPLRDEGLQYAQKLRNAGVNVQYHMYDGMIHGFVSFYSLLPEGKDAIKEISIFVKNSL